MTSTVLPISFLATNLMNCALAPRETKKVESALNVKEISFPRPVNPTADKIF